MCIHEHVFVNVHVHDNVYMNLYLYMYMYMCMYACMYVCMYVCRHSVSNAVDNVLVCAELLRFLPMERQFLPVDATFDEHLGQIGLEFQRRNG